MVKHGQKYRVLSPKKIWELEHPGKVYREPKIFGAGNTGELDRYTVTINGERFEDLFGDVITASENVDYPHGPNDAYRSIDYIEENIQRFELIEDVEEESETTNE